MNYIVSKPNHLTQIIMNNLSAFIAVIASSFIVLTGCHKESPATDQRANNNSINGNVQAQNGIPPRPIDQFTGLYDATGTRILYTGNINDSVILLVVDVPSPKVMTAADNYTLVCDYADLGASGWQSTAMGSEVKVCAKATLAGTTATPRATTRSDRARFIIHLVSQDFA